MRKTTGLLVNLLMIALLVLAFAGCSTVSQSTSQAPVAGIPSNIQETLASDTQTAENVPMILRVMDYEARIERKDDKTVLVYYPSVVYPQDLISFGQYLYAKYPDYFVGSSFVLLGDNTAYLELGYPFTDDEVREYLPAIASEIEAFVPVYIASLQEAGAPVRLSEKAIAEAAAQKAEAEKAESTAEMPVAVSTPVSVEAVAGAEELPAPESVQNVIPAETVKVPEVEVQSAPVSEKAVEIGEAASAAEKAGRNSSGPIILVAVIVILAASCVCYYLYTKKKKN